MSNPERPILILGGGLSGLACADALGALGRNFVLVEANPFFGGLTSNAELEGCTFELGPHVYFTADDEVTEFWRGLGGDSFRSHTRRTKLYYSGNYIHSPLRIKDALRNLGVRRIAKMLAGYLGQRFKPEAPTESAKDWIVQKFGNELYDQFFKVYNEKIWGVSCERIDPAWSGQRVKTSLVRILFDTLFRKRGLVVKSFNFPDGGSKTLVERLVARVQGYGVGELKSDVRVSRILLDGSRVSAVGVMSSDGSEETIEVESVVSTLPLKTLFSAIQPPPSDSCERALECLRYRNLVMVLVVADESSVLNFSEHWIDVHDPEIRALRVTNFANYRGSSLAADGKSAIGVEYNTWADDEIESMSDGEIVDVARRDLAAMGILPESDSAASMAVRVPFAYPVYDLGFRRHVDFLSSWLGENACNLVLTGRNGLFKWNNMHHSVRSGQLAARNIALGEANDLSSIESSV